MSRQRDLNVEISECEKELKYLRSQITNRKRISSTGFTQSLSSNVGSIKSDNIPNAIGTRSGTPRRLIISSGDISDVDGLYAIAKYATTGCDVIFVMNYPAYLRETGDLGPGFSDKTVDPGLLDPGLGYRYDTESFLNEFERGRESKKAEVGYVKYQALLYEIYKDIGDISGRVKQVLTDIAYSMVARTWSDVNFSGKGTLYFCVGGVNSFNPFSASALKNEIYVYSDLMAVIESGSGGSSTVETRMQRLGPCEEGVIFKQHHIAENKIPEGFIQVGSSIHDFVTLYKDVYIDFNGSMAFFNDEWEMALKNCQNEIRCVCVMGGVFSFEPPGTMPSIAKVLNRFSCATMNQLYHPSNTAKFFRLLGELSISVYVIANNAVGTQETIDAQKKKTDNGWMRFFHTNFNAGYFFSDIQQKIPALQEFAGVYYNSEYNPPRRAFDFYTAVALVNVISRVRIGSDANLFFDGVYGITLISNKTDYRDAVDEYSSRINVDAAPEDNDFIKSKKANFRREIDILKSCGQCEMIRVKNVKFDDVPGSMLRVRPADGLFELVLRVGYFPATHNLWLSQVIQDVSGDDLYNGADELQIKIKFSAQHVPTSLVFSNGNTWGSPQSSGLGRGSADWPCFLEYHVDRPAKTTIRIVNFDRNQIKLALEAFGPEASASSGESTESVCIDISFRA